jgi:DNA-binding Lrp family transcriptional regulator
MKLRNQDVRILQALDENARASYSKIGSKANVSKETARYRVHALEESGTIVTYTAGYEPAFSNHQLYRIYYRLSQVTPELEEEILQYFLRQKESVFIDGCEGRFDIIVTLMVQTSYELDAFSRKLHSRYAQYIAEESLHVITIIHYYQLFTSLKKMTYHSHTNKTVTFDDIDKQIIEYLVKSPRANVTEIAMRIHSTARIVLYRLKQLEKAQVIRHYGVNVDAKRIGKNRFFLHINLRNRKDRSTIESFFCGKKMLRRSTHELGRYNLSIELLIDSIELYRDVLEEFKRTFHSSYASFDTSFVLRHEFNGMYPVAIERK